MGCTLCPRKCGVDRDNKIGFCGVGNTLRVARAALHFYEEPCISGTDGSGTVFFCGCNLSCVYCQNYAVSRNTVGREVTPTQLASIFRRLQDDGAHNINLVSPTQYSVGIKSALDIAKLSIPIVYNTNGYEDSEVLRGLRDYVSVYLTDYKYLDNNLAQKYSGAKDYAEVATAALRTMLDNVGAPVYDDEGMLKSGVIVRHLVLPGQVRHSIKVLEYLRANFPNIIISVMLQYTPFPNAMGIDELGRQLNALECKVISNTVDRLDFDCGYIQDISSADSAYTPEFDLTGVLNEDII